MSIFFLLCFIPNVSFADDVIPNWVVSVYDYWSNSQISTVEFYHALEYLVKNNIITLTLDSEYDLVANFLITFTSQQHSLTDSFQDCSSDWYITGYFTPVEDDYSGELEKISINNYIHYAKSDFVDAVKIEGWGKTMQGNYLGWYGGSFHHSKFPLDSHGNYLVPQSVAVDSSIIPQSTHLVIPQLPSPWNMIIFESSDIGPSIIGKHIDVYTGEGNQAELETFRITGENNDVCVEFSEE